MIQRSTGSPSNIREWFAFYIKPRHEKKAAARLEEQFKIYCPLKEERIRWSDRWKTVVKPLVPGYIFANVTESERLHLLQDPSVFRTVCFKGKPAIIREREMEAMKKVLGETDCEDIRLEPLNKGDRVEITGGSFQNVNGVVVTIKGNRASLRLDSLNCAMTFTVSAAILELV